MILGPHSITMQSFVNYDTSIEVFTILSTWYPEKIQKGDITDDDINKALILRQMDVDKEYGRYSGLIKRKVNLNLIKIKHEYGGLEAVMDRDGEWIEDVDLEFME